MAEFNQRLTALENQFQMYLDSEINTRVRRLEERLNSDTRVLVNRVDNHTADIEQILLNNEAICQRLKKLENAKKDADVLYGTEQRLLGDFVAWLWARGHVSRLIPRINVTKYLDDRDWHESNED